MFDQKTYSFVSCFQLIRKNFNYLPESFRDTRSKIIYTNINRTKSRATKFIPKNIYSCIFVYLFVQYCNIRRISDCAIDVPIKFCARMRVFTRCVCGGGVSNMRNVTLCMFADGRVGASFIQTQQQTMRQKLFN